MNESLQPKRLISYFFILAIAVVFTLQFGPGSRGCDAPLRPSPRASAALVNGKEVSIREFQDAYMRQLQMFRLQGNSLPESVVRQLGIPRQVLDYLIDVELLAQTAQREGVAASDTEIAETIHKNRDFQKDGEFDFERYGEVVREFHRKSVPEFEAEIRRQMTYLKMKTLVENGAFVSDEELKEKFFQDNNKAQLAFVRFSPTQFASKVSPPTSAELAAFQKDHEKEISDHYESNRFLYQKPEQVRARHILIKVEKDAPQQQKDEAKQKLEKIRQEIVGGKDFAEAAKQYSEDPGTKDNGGDLGFNERQGWTPPFADAAFSLKPGDLSQPIEDQYGLHLIKVEEKMPPSRKELKDVEPEIAKQLYTKEKSKELARAEAEKALAAAKGGKKLAQLYPSDKDKKEKEKKDKKDKKDNKKKDLATLQNADQPAVVETGAFTLSAQTIPQLGMAPELLADSFTVDKPQLLPKVYSSGESVVVAEVTERTHAADSDFAGKKESLRQEAIRAKQMELEQSYIKALKKTATISINDELVGKSSERVF